MRGGGSIREEKKKTDGKKKAALACFLSPRPLISHPSGEGARSTVSTCSESLRSTARSLQDCHTNRTVRGKGHAEAPAASIASVPHRHHCCRRSRRRIDDDAAFVAVGHGDGRRRGGQGRPRRGSWRGEAEVRPHAGSVRCARERVWKRKAPPGELFFFSLFLLPQQSEIANGLDVVFFRSTSLFLRSLSLSLSLLFDVKNREEGEPPPPRR